MNNKNRLFRVTSLLLVLCFVSTVMISGTFAKYTSTFAGQDTALIAKWDLNVTDGTTAFATPTAPETLDLFSHVYTGNMIGNAGTQNIIAPGVSDSFVLSVKNNSDVAAKVEFDFDISDGSAVNVPIEYSLTNDFVTKYETVGALATALNDLSEFMTLAPGMTNPATKTVYWRWSFNPTFSGQDDTKDTALGTQSVTDNRSTYVLNVTATATQLAPAPSTAVALSGVTIDGDTEVGQTLTAVLIPAAAIATYQWQSGTVATGYVNISGATSSTYILVAGDVGKNIRVIATGQAPGYTGTKISTATGSVTE